MFPFFCSSTLADTLNARPIVYVLYFLGTSIHYLFLCQDDATAADTEMAGLRASVKAHDGRIRRMNQYLTWLEDPHSGTDQQKHWYSAPSVADLQVCVTVSINTSVVACLFVVVVCLCSNLPISFCPMSVRLFRRSLCLFDVLRSAVQLSLISSL
jgi:hypothetical protein